MTDHLSPAILNALADGELSAQQLARANEHLSGCSPCTASALHISLLKSATAKAGSRYSPPRHLERRIRDEARGKGRKEASGNGTSRRSTGRFGMLGWAAAVALLAFAATMIVQRVSRGTDVTTARNTALINEAFDQHVATLAQGLPPQVVSSDRHTVKPWFQGKIPFSFNLPQDLPIDITLDGANLAYLDSQPVAQLLYSIGRHRVSVFVRQRAPSTTASAFVAEHAGFHEVTFSANEVQMIAVSDVDPARLAELASLIKQAQTGEATQPR